MELIDYTNKWVTGEILEDLAMIAGGVICLLLALVAWRWGTSESARAIILPLTALALILIALVALTIGFFSKERGVIYQRELNSIQIEKVE